MLTRPDRPPARRRRPRGRRHRRLATVVAVALATCVFGGPVALADGYRPPVPGDVLRPLELGDGPYASGHRGVDLRVMSGQPVHAAADGTVAFSGVVAGVRWLSIDHLDGVRTTYGPLRDVTVPVGEQVAAGQPVATATGEHDGRGALHWSARRGLRYLDPLSLLGPQPAWRPTLVGQGGWSVTDLPDVPSYDAWDGQHRWGFVPGSPDADGPGWLLAPNPNHVIVIAGFGSASGGFHIDMTDLGYPPSAITELSHAGRGADAPGAPDDPRRDQQPYGPSDTFVGVQRLAEQLRDQLRAHAARNPGQAVDLVAHSMGGVVAMHYLLTMHDPTDPTLPPIDHVATFSSPLEGSALSNFGDGVAGSLVGEALLRLTGSWDATTSRTAEDLAVGSALLRDLAGAWDHATDDRFAGPLATGTEVLTVGASRDLVVAEHRSELPGAAHVVVPGGHSSALDTEAARIVLRAFLANGPTVGESGGLGHWLSYGVSGLERGLGYAAPGLDRLLPGGWLTPALRQLTRP